MKEIDDLIKQHIKFRDERNWKQFHTPENLSKSIVIEANELLENYQWGNDHADLDNVKEEVADIFGYLLMLCNELDIDLIEVSKSKIEKNKLKYPVNKAYGKSTKYNKL